MPKEVTLKVEKTYPNDSGRGIARLGDDARVRLQVSPGDVVEIRGKKSAAAIVWRAEKTGNAQDCIKIDGYTRQSADVGIGDTVTVVGVEKKSAYRVVFAPMEGSILTLGKEDKKEIEKQVLKRALVEGNIVPVTKSIIGVGVQTVPLVAVATEPKGVVFIDEDTKIELQEKPSGRFEVHATGVTYEEIGGLRDEIQRVREMIELPIKHPEIFQKLGVEPPKGVLLYGPPGTGKTLIAKAVASESGAHFFSIAGPEIISSQYGESERRLREKFESAQKTAPSIVFIDELDSIAPKREDVTGEVERRVVAQLLAIMDGLKERGQIIVIGATNRVNAIDPALRRPGRFDREIELGVPGMKDRAEILQIHMRNMPLADDVNMDALVAHTHGFVGADIAALCKEAAMKSLRRYIPEINLGAEHIPEDILNKIKVTMQDFRDALREVEPSAMREVLLEVPQVRWEDIGGLDEVKQEVREVVEWPLKNPERFKKMGIKPPKGILLFGPPGTGKTLIAKAVATESEANFICIRGPEMMSKWFGESEKAVREIFRKARQVAPSIIFFDEIDAIAPMRGLEEGSRVAERIVNQLLSEMDGLQVLENVVIIAATNRPDIIDPALVRPGRFDRILMVGAPSRAGRKEIFRIHMENMPVAKDVDVEQLTDMTESYVGSDIEALCREAAIIALREDSNASEVQMKNFMEALKKVKPSVNENMMQYYEKIKERLEGGIAAEKAKSHEGYR